MSEALDAMLQQGCFDVSEGTKAMYAAKSEVLKKYLGPWDVNDLTKAMVLDYIGKRTESTLSKQPSRKGKGTSRSTIFKELVTLRKALDHAADLKRFTHSVEEVVPQFRVRYEPRTRYLSESEFELLVKHLPEKRLLWVALSVFTSARASEVEAILWSNVDLAGHRITLPGTKTQRSRRTIPMSDVLVRLLSPLAKASPATAPVVEPWTNVRRDLAAACVKAEAELRESQRIRGEPLTAVFPRVSPNDLRRTFASWLKQRGQDSWVVAQMMGHSSSRMIELVYGRLNETALRMAVNKLPDVKLPEDCSSGVAAASSGDKPSPSGTK